MKNKGSIQELGSQVPNLQSQVSDYANENIMNEKILELLNAYLDNQCEVDGVRKVLRELVALGGDKETLLAMSFYEADIDMVLEESEE